MDKLIYLCYPILALILFWKAKIFRKNTWNEECFSLAQTKALQGFCAICIMFHHIGQKTSAHWLNPKYIRPGLEPFVPVGYILVGIFLFCSGYGLYKSCHQKPNYLEGFFRRRILPLILGFYSTGIIFLIVRFLLGQKINLPQFLFYLTGLQLSNPNTWYVIAVPIFLLGFYLSFRFCRDEKRAIFFTALWVFIYVLIGTMIDHNPWWMRGEWWYNSSHFFIIGLLFARHENAVLDKVKRHYALYVIIAFLLTFLLYGVSEFAQGVFSYYGENFHANFKVLRRWVCLLSQIGASCAFVFFVFLLGMKIKIGNKILNFMGSITLEFYLIHGLFVELFAFSFDGVCSSLYYIKNPALYVLVVAVLSVPSAVLLQRLHRHILKAKAPKTDFKNEI